MFAISSLHCILFFDNSAFNPDITILRIFHTDDSGRDDVLYGSGYTLSSGNSTDKASSTTHGSGTPSNLDGNQTGTSTFDDSQKSNSSASASSRTHYSASGGTVTDYSNNQDESHATGKGSTFGTLSGPNITTTSNQYDYKTSADGKHSRNVTYNAAGAENGTYSNSDSSTLDEKTTTTETGTVPWYPPGPTTGTAAPEAIGTITYGDSDFNHENQSASDSEQGTVTAGANNGTYESHATDDVDWKSKLSHSITTHTFDFSGNDYGRITDITTTAKGTSSGNTTAPSDSSGSVIAGKRVGTETDTGTENSTTSLNSTDVGSTSNTLNAGMIDEYSASDTWNNKNSISKTVNDTETAVYAIDAAGNATTTSDTGTWNETSTTGGTEHHVSKIGNGGGSGPKVKSELTFDRTLSGTNGYSKEGTAAKGRVDQKSTGNDTSKAIWKQDSTPGSDGTGDSYHVDVSSTLVSNSTADISTSGDKVLSLKNSSLYSVFLSDKWTNTVTGEWSLAVRSDRISSQSEGTASRGTGTKIEDALSYDSYSYAPATPDPVHTVTDLSWPQTTWLDRNVTTVMNTVQVIVGLAEMAGGMITAGATCGGGLIPGAIAFLNGADAVAMGVAGLIDGESYGSGFGSLASEGMQAVGVPAGIADIAGELLPIALSMGSSAFAKACFAAGTKLWTPDGYRNIEDLKSGDYVMSRHEADPDGAIEAKMVEETFTSLAKVFHLHIEDKVIRTTAEHPFYAKDKGWTNAGDLEIGDLVYSADQRWLKITDLLDTGEFEAVYNMRIADYHTYFVGDEGWDFDVWSHNACSATSGNNVANALGRLAHTEYAKAWKSLGWAVEHILPSGKRIDAVDLINKVVRELKPNNPKAIARGWAQGQRVSQLTFP